MKIMQTKTYLALGLLLAAPLVPLPTVHANQPPATATKAEVPAFVVTGVGEVTLTPNIAYITLGVETQDMDSTKAVTQNAAKMESLMKVVRAFGIAEKDIQTTNYSIYKQPSYEPNPAKGKPTAYTVNNQVRIAVRKFTDTGKIIDGVTQVGGNVAQGIEFDADDETKDAAYDKALEKAITATRRKVKTMASAGGVQVGMLLELTEGGTDNSPRPMFKAAMVAESRAATPISGGELSVRATVTARYAIAP